MLDFIFKGRIGRRIGSSLWKSLTGYTPVFTSWAGELYESELVRSSIDAIARHVSKLNVRFTGTAKPKTVAMLNRAPNSLQTWGQFLYRLATILYMQDTAFIVPSRDELGRIDGLWTVLPSRCEVIDYNGVPWLKYTFSNGQSAAAPLDEVGVMTRHQYKDDLFGDGNYAALKSTMDMIHIQAQGIAEATKNSNTYRFMARLNNWSSDEDLALERKRFTAENFGTDESNGVLLFPNTYSDIRQIEAKSYVIDPETIRTTQTNVFNYFGTNEKILQNSASPDEWSMFYEGCIEVFAIQLCDVIRGIVFSEREVTLGSDVLATSDRLAYMSDKDKLEFSASMSDRGLMTRNEIRVLWGLPPLDEAIGDTIPVRGEYYNLGHNDDKNIDAGGETNAGETGA